MCVWHFRSYCFDVVLMWEFCIGSRRSILSQQLVSVYSHRDAYLAEDHEKTWFWRSLFIKMSSVLIRISRAIETLKSRRIAVRGGDSFMRSVVISSWEWYSRTDQLLWEFTTCTLLSVALYVVVVAHSVSLLQTSDKQWSSASPGTAFWPLSLGSSRDDKSGAWIGLCFREHDQLSGSFNGRPQF